MGTGVGESTYPVFGSVKWNKTYQAAVSSPLLEDINLAGAHGILVNVTAGLDLSIGEFEEIGNRMLHEWEQGVALSLKAA